MKKINNIEELRAEILRLKVRKKEQELSLKKRVDDFTDKFQPVIGVLDFFGVVESDGPSGGSKNAFGSTLMKKSLEYGLPFLMNRLFFRSNVKAGISSLLGIALGESAKTYLSSDPSKLVDPIVDFIRNLVDGRKERRKTRKEKRSFENRYDNLEREIYS